MAFAVKLHKSVDKFLDKHPELRERFIECAVALSQNPFPTQDQELDIGVYKGEGENKFRLRISKYRFLYEVFKAEVFIFFFDADKRGDVY